MGGALHRSPRSRGPRLESPKLYVKLVRDVLSRNLRKMNKILNILVQNRKKIVFLL
jgi:hypothetical protein